MNEFKIGDIVNVIDHADGTIKKGKIIDIKSLNEYTKRYTVKTIEGEILNNIAEYNMEQSVQLSFDNVINIGDIVGALMNSVEQALESSVELKLSMKISTFLSYLMEFDTIKDTEKKEKLIELVEKWTCEYNNLIKGGEKENATNNRKPKNS